MGYPAAVSQWEVADRIREFGSRLTVAERRVAMVVLERPQVVGFGTVADLAAASGTGAATVVRLASKLGFDGFTALQASVQGDLSRQLGPAAERIHGIGGGQPVSDHRAWEEANVRGTLDSVDPAVLDQVVGQIADRSTSVWVLAGEAERGVAIQFANDLASLRPRVHMIGGSDVAVRRELALAELPALMVAIDLRRYEAWVIDTAERARTGGMSVVAMTDGPLSPLAAIAERSFMVSAASVSPFDSHVGTLALSNLLVARVAERMRGTAAERLSAVESAWAATGALRDG